ncbi:hypothetical protein ACH4L5_24050 [Streptomyces sp. NPDC017405]|uniref:hypothetical protein n=1 Tax=unclassified Streptomyces TaxID=2593676 RepID=UPI00378C544A
MTVAVSVIALILASASCALSLAVAIRVKKILDPIVDGSVAAQTSTIAKGTKIPDVGILRDAAGEEVQLHRDQGEAWILTFLSSNCSGCAAQLPDYKRFIAAHNIPTSRVVTIVTGKGEKADTYAQEVAQFSRVVRPQDNLNALISVLGVRLFPTFLVVTPTGEVKHSTTSVSTLGADRTKLAGV